MKILIGGGSGFVGHHLSKFLSSLGHEVTWISRRPQPGQVSWQPDDLARRIGDFNGVINLAGENIFSKRWSLEQMDSFKRSRVQTTRVLVEAVAASKPKLDFFINASAIGYYGSEDSSAEYTEDAEPGDDSLAQICVDWEKEALRAQDLNVRTAIVRIGVVMGQEDGALKKMVAPFRFYAGGWQGSGQQYVSWVHILDLVRIFGFLIERRELSGVFNATAPHPATNYDICQNISRILRKPNWLPVPAWVLREVLGDVSVLIVNGQKVVPRNLLEAGFQFRFPGISSALEGLLTQKKIENRDI